MKIYFEKQEQKNDKTNFKFIIIHQAFNTLLEILDSNFLIIKNTHLISMFILKIYGYVRYYSKLYSFSFDYSLNYQIILKCYLKFVNLSNKFVCYKKYANHSTFKINRFSIVLQIGKSLLSSFSCLICIIIYSKMESKGL